MVKLVVLTQSMAGRSCDLAGERTTIGRIEENTFQIAEPSVSSRHCEILLRGGEVVIKDLNSTNGTFINGEKISEGVLKPGQTLRVGNVELKLETAGSPEATATLPSKSESAKDTSPGINPREFESGGTATGTSTIFTKKKKSNAMIFWVIAGVIVVVIIVLLLVNLSKITGH